MTPNKSGRAALLLAGLLLVAATPPAGAQGGGNQAAQQPAPATLTVSRSSQKQAQALLDKAVAYLQQHPAEQAYAAFNNQKGPFVRDDLYVFVFDLETGVMHAHGGSPEGLVGMNVIDLRDASGKPIIREMADVAKTKGSGNVDYVWLNRKNNHLESKTSLVKRVGNNVVSVGYYVPRGSPEEARDLLKRAVAAVRANPAEAFQAFDTPTGRFTHYDLYVFVVGINDGKFYAMGANPGLVGTDVKDLKNAEGKPIIQDMINIAKEKGSGEYEYAWRNPADNKVEKKHSYIEKVGDYVVGVGYYTKQ
ncbi:MAG TPA: cache domain-containing protein [Burkholderiales bacterium]|nr:cache domain-containing protein [Burkholderiales bacterium]